jgi:uncharacterized protein YkwD
LKAAVFAFLIALLPATAVGADLQSSLLAEINAVRTKQGVAPLRRDPRLDRVAQAHTRSMVERNFFDHRGRDGKRVGERLIDAGYGFLFAGENLSAGIEDPASVVRQWMSSRDHRENLLDLQAMEVGIGYVASPQGRYGHYWTLVLAKPVPP